MEFQCKRSHELAANGWQRALLPMHLKLKSVCAHSLLSFSVWLYVQAAFILQNLLLMPMPANAEEAEDSHWQVSRSASQFESFLWTMNIFFSPIPLLYTLKPFIPNSHFLSC